MEDPLSNIVFKTSTTADGNMSFQIGDTGNSLQHRENFLSLNAVMYKNHICMRCTHGEQIVSVNWNTQAQYFGTTRQEDMLLAEVLITQEKGLALMLLTADCLPVSLYDPVTQTIALAHFSRETIAKKLPRKTIGFLKEQFGVAPSDILISVGPYIHTNSYSFPSNDHNIHRETLPYTKESAGRIHVDLIQACNAQLSHEGVDITKSTVTKINTYSSPDHFSHYGSGTKNDPEGRLVTILMLR